MAMPAIHYAEMESCKMHIVYVIHTKTTKKNVRLKENEKRTTMEWRSMENGKSKGESESKIEMGHCFSFY